MINWKNHRAALTGASKTLIRGVISVVHSVTSQSVIVTPDCVTTFESQINDTPLALVSTIDAGVIAIESNIQPTVSFSSIINIQNNFEGLMNALPLVFDGQIDATPIAVNGVICS